VVFNLEWIYQDATEGPTGLYRICDECGERAALFEGYGRELVTK
jgi:hypothetical protein